MDKTTFDESILLKHVNLEQVEFEITSIHLTNVNETNNDWQMNRIDESMIDEEDASIQILPQQQDLDTILFLYMGLGHNTIQWTIIIAKSFSNPVVNG